MSFADRLDRLEETVYGNGQPGLTTRVHSLEEARTAVQLSEQDMRAVYRGPLVTGLIIAAVTIIAQYFLALASG